MYSNKVVDFGTPAKRSDNTVTVHIDGKPVCVPAGTSVMRAAVEAGVQVPKLCATDSLESFGSCRLCLVEIDGRRGTHGPSKRRLVKPVHHKGEQEQQHEQAIEPTQEPTI